MWHNLFDLDVSMLEKMLRPIVVYVFLLVGLRLSGKRELAQLNAMDLIVLLILSNTVQNSIIGPDNSLSGGLIGATTLLVVNYAVVRFLFTHEKIGRWVEGQGVKLIAGGKLQRGAMRHELITRSELAAAAHNQGFAKLSDVEEAELEPSGVVSFVGKSPTASETRFQEIIERLDSLTQQISQLRGSLGSGGHP